jgi:hypothetical protein
MPKWFAIRASAAIAIVGSVATLLFAAGLAIAALLTPPRETGPLPPGAMKIAGVAVAALFASGAAWGIGAGVGIFRRRSWARISMTLFAGLLAMLGVTGALAMIAMPFGESPGIDQRMAAVVRVSMIGFYALIAALGAWWLILFTRRPALQYFAASEASPDTRPVSISVIAWYLLGSAVITAFAAALRAPTAIFGFVVSGWAAAAVYTLYTAAQIYLGSGLLELNNAARAWSIVYFFAAAANGAALALNPGMREKGQELALTLEGYSRAEIPNIGIAWWAAAAAAALPIWFLVRRRSAFDRGGQQGATPDAAGGGAS